MAGRRLERELEDLGRRLAAHRDQEEKLQREMRRLVAKATAAGLSRRAVGQYLGISGAAVQKIVERSS